MMQEPKNGIQIQPFTTNYRDAVISLILPIQQIEFGVPVTANDQPDLLDIPDYYFKGHGNFWIATMNGKVIGSIGLLDFRKGRFALRKMFVAREYRGSTFNIAQQLLQTARDWVNSHDGSEIYLGTVEVLKAAQRFYEKNGFSLVEQKNLPAEFPRMPVDTIFYHIQIR